MSFTDMENFEHLSKRLKLESPADSTENNNSYNNNQNLASKIMQMLQTKNNISNSTNGNSYASSINSPVKLESTTPNNCFEENGTSIFEALIGAPPHQKLKRSCQNLKN